MRLFAEPLQKPPLSLCRCGGRCLRMGFQEGGHFCGAAEHKCGFSEEDLGSSSSESEVAQPLLFTRECVCA